ncbi:aspartic peptidase domain-containing protein [Mycena filopes]|nr:aspartic peptidase domain-containing protein [Mycena filopes]
MVGLQILNSIHRTPSPSGYQFFQVFSVEVDLGSSATWLYGTDCKDFETGPRGTAGSAARFWNFFENSTSSKLSSKEHVRDYADGSHVYFNLYSDFVQFQPHRPLPTQERGREWCMMVFGVAQKLLGDFKLSPASGILGLGRSISDLSYSDEPVSFLQQIGSQLRSPELVIMLSPVRGTVTFGRRSQFQPSNMVGPWFNDIPVLGSTHWIVSSKRKILNGRESKSKNGTLVLDTGAAFCYVDHTFAQDVYATIPGSRWDVKNSGSGNRQRGLFMVPLDLKETEAPTIEFDVGGYLFKLEDFFLSREKLEIYEHKNIAYAVGAIQSTDNLFPQSASPYTGPEIMGRVALMNMELVCQFPNDKPHTISWRRKDRRLLVE